MTFRIGVLSALFATGGVAFAPFACSSSGNGGYSITNCPSEPLTTSCASCLESVGI